MANSKKQQREVFDPKFGVYRKEHFLPNMGVKIRRGDTRHGDYSEIRIWNWSNDEKDSQTVSLSLSEARALKAFLDRELEVLAR